MSRERIYDIWTRTRYRAGMSPQQIWYAGWDEAMGAEQHDDGPPGDPAPLPLAQLIDRLAKHDPARRVTMPLHQRDQLVALLRELRARRIAMGRDPDDERNAVADLAQTLVEIVEAFVEIGACGDAIAECPHGAKDPYDCDELCPRVP